MPNAPQHVRIDIQEVRHRNRTAKAILANLSDSIPHLTNLLHYLNIAIDDVPFLVFEVKRLASEVAATRLNLANLVAAAHATLNSHRDEEPDPLYYLRDELSAQGFLPPSEGGRV
ncbi:hypothetical protein OG417_07740 [Actinoallomurus sp. NBC_01490]|uniref:hypothetical protein n=1 Tax=Actinoallomurus sp. NBC_01490 TaxID=2903557 RepID=UPI002E2F8599|nr:hypothetical protein [Actinoallomurus sp. NBC_01490]